MTRRKVNLAYMIKDGARRATLKRRKNGLLKKVKELRSLCDIDVCAIIFSPSENEPMVWPSPLDAQNVITKFRALPESEQIRNMVNQQTFTRKVLTKVESQHRNKQKENRHKDLTKVIYGCLVGQWSFQYLNIIDSRELVSLLNQNILDAARRIEFLKKGNLPNV